MYIWSRHSYFGPIFLSLMFIFGCGGGGSSADSSANAGGGIPTALAPMTINWVPPVAYSDNTSLNPTTDLNDYEIYISQSGVFSDADSPAAVVAAVDPGTHQVVTSFDLVNLSPFLTRGVIYFVSMRSVAVDGLKSEFSNPASFSL